MNTTDAVNIQAFPVPQIFLPLTVAANTGNVAPMDQINEMPMDQLNIVPTASE